MRTCETKLRYFDWDGQVHITKGKTGGQQGDLLEIRTVTYADDGYIKGKLSETLQVLTELKRVLKEDAGLELNISKPTLPKDDLRDSSSWSSPPLMLLRDIHSKFIDQYDCKEVCAPSPPQVNAGARARPRCQDGVPPQQEAAPLSLPQLNRLFEASFARDESSASTAGVAAIPSQFKVTQQILLHWQPFRDLNLEFVGSRRAEQLRWIYVEKTVLMQNANDSVRDRLC